MSYQVLARKWRPTTFETLVGQEHVLQALRHALDGNRLHHAYLFTGTRGVGKTTIARILARSLNCDEGVSASPCGVCASCVEIAEGRSVDLIEVDAASRTKVEDTRELLDNVQYAPTRSRFKVYLIDEVHMLSGHSFNALLKTLEEPPEHVKFLLATTDPQKLPATVLSRCLQFNLKNLSAERVVEHLRHVLTEEAVSFEDPALWLLGRAAAGSMRDALSLTDQAIAFGNGALSEGDVAAMLGTVDRQHTVRLLEAVLEDEPAAALQACAAMGEQGADFSSAVDDLAGLLHRVAVAQVAPGAVDREFGDADKVVELAGRMSGEDVQLFYDLAQRGREQVQRAADSRAAFEMLVLRLLAFRPVAVLDPALGAEDLAPAKDSPTVDRAVEAAGGAKKPEPPRAAQGKEPPSPAMPAPASAAVPDSASVPDVTAPKVATPTPAVPAADPAPPVDPSLPPWHECLDDLELTGSALNVASHCVLESIDGDAWILRLDETRTNLFNERHVNVICAALSRREGREVRLAINVGRVQGETPAMRRERLQAERQREAEAAIADDPRVQRLVEDFQAQIVRGSVTVEHP